LRRELREEVEKAVCSISTFRVLAEMASKPSKAFTKYALKKATMLNERDVANALRKLVEVNWVEELDLGRVKLYRLNVGNERVKVFVEFLRNIGYI